MSTPPTHPSKTSSGISVDPIFEDEHGRLWLDPSRIEPLADGLDDFMILEWRGAFYELQGQRVSDGLWWVEVCDLTISRRDHAAYASLTASDDAGKGTGKG